MRIPTNLWSTLFFAIIVFASIAYGQRQAQCCEEYCYDLDSERPQSAHFSTKTAYQIAKGSDAGRQFYVPSKIILTFLHRIIYKFHYSLADCDPTKIWLFSRHGTRLPGANSIKSLRKLEDVSVI